MPKEEIDNMVKIFEKRRDLILSEIAKIEGVSAVKPNGAFYVMLVVSGVYGKQCHGRTIDGSIAFSDALLETEKVAVVPGISFGADDCVRLSYSLSEEDIVEGIRRIGKFVAALR